MATEKRNDCLGQCGADTRNAGYVFGFCTDCARAILGKAADSGKRLGVLLPRKLRERADSYERDAQTFLSSPDLPDNVVWGNAYRAIASELREAAR